MQNFLINLKRNIQQQRFFRPDPNRDVFLVSYPRSGNTWLRGVIFDLIMKRLPHSLKEIDYVVPDIHYKMPTSQILKQPFYAVKSHDVFRLDKEHRYRNVIYVVRDPRNVLASYRRYLAMQNRTELPVAKFYRDIIQGRYWPCSWHEHVVNWWYLEDTEWRTTTKVRYEDLVMGDITAWRMFGRALDVVMEPEAVTRIARDHDLAATHELERQGNRPNLERGEIWFVGSGKSGENEIELINDAIRTYAPQMWELMVSLGYAEGAEMVKR